MRKRVLILSHDKVGDKMAGPGIRYHFMAEILAERFDVTLGAFNPKYIENHTTSYRYKARSVDIHSFKDAFDGADFIIALWLSPDMIAYANAHSKVIIFDIYAPVPVEIMAQMLFAHKAPGELENQEYIATVQRYVEFLRYGDLFLVSNERQLDYWVGFGFGTGAVTPLNFGATDPFRRLAVAPMGIDISNKLVHDKDVLRGVVGNISNDDLLLVWTGGLWDWFDAQAVIKAMHLLKDHKNIKFVFLGTQHPNDEIPEMAETVQTRVLAEKLGVINKSVYFLDGWLDYAGRVNYLLEADAAVYAHKPSIEARYSHRTRVLDHILVSLPTIATAGDYFADEIRDKEIGLEVPPGDPQALADAILSLQDKKILSRLRSNIEKIRPEYDWHTVLAPVVDFIEKTDPTQKKPITRPTGQPTLKPLLYRTAKRYLPHRVKRLILRAVRFVR